MPARSKAQYRLMKAGMSQEQAAEYTKSNVGKKRFSKLKEKLGKK